MGWFFSHNSRRELIDDLTRESISPEGEVFRTLQKCFRGNTMYALHESGQKGNLHKWIGIYLIQRGGPYWGYKAMSEDMHPYYYDCPVSFLDEADEPTTKAASEWRAIVRDLAAKRVMKKPKKGETWTLVGCKVSKVTVTSLRPLWGRGENGITYKIKRAYLGEKVA